MAVNESSKTAPEVPGFESGSTVVSSGISSSKALHPQSHMRVILPAWNAASSLPPAGNSLRSAMNSVHRAAFDLSFGMLGFKGWTAVETPNLLLTDTDHVGERMPMTANTVHVG